jgi:transcriptional regulator with XRE-family HTH domain
MAPRLRRCAWILVVCICFLREGRDGRAGPVPQQDLAKQAGVSQQLIGHYENGIRAPKLEKAILLAKALGVPVEAINGQLEKRKPGESRPHQHRKIWAI